MLLQVPDELLLEAPRAEVDASLELVRNRMEHAADLKVPLLVESGIGENWLECK
jgi:DNA polymerase-1